MIEISKYSDDNRNEIIALVLHCQNDGTRPHVTVENQPELLNIKENYIEKGGNFWVAKDNGKVAGCIGLMKYNSEIAILKKFFVYEAYRGKPHYLGRKLYETLLKYATENGYTRLILDTPKNTQRAHKFYTKAGFRQVEKSEYPANYVSPYEDNDYFCLDISKKFYSGVL